MADKPPILLLKSPSPTPSSDPYTTHLSPALTPHFVPVLSHELRPDVLIKLLLKYLDPAAGRWVPGGRGGRDTDTEPSDGQDGEQGHGEVRNGKSGGSNFPFGALLLTSQRAAASLNAALSSPIIQSKVTPSRLQNLRLTLYVVGPATARAAEEVRVNHLPACRVIGGGGGGKEGKEVVMAGNGEELARVILGEKGAGGYEVWEDEEEGEGLNGEEVNGTKKKRKKPVLFLTGETRRDVLPRMLQSVELPEEERVEVEEMVVYASTELQEFEFGFQSTLERTRSVEGGVRWTVVFSPMGGRGMLRGLGFLEEGKERVDRGKMEGRRDFVCCIGPTTRAYLEREFGFEADVVAERPSPEGVGEGIELFMSRRERGEVL